MFSFCNPGLIDIRAITTMGVSVKEGDTPIGYFGTGLKYSIATILRTGGSIAIYSGTERFDFTTKSELIRGKTFDLIHMNGLPLGFTTELGRNWEPWMAFRELYSNMLDEGGKMYSRQLLHDPWGTMIEVEHPRFAEIVRDIDKYFIQTEPSYREKTLEIHPGIGQRVFYRGVFVGETQLRSIFTYNIVEENSLTEDRTISPFTVDRVISNAIVKSTNRKLIHEFLTAPLDSYENETDISYWFSGKPSTEFLEIAETAFRRADRPVNKSVYKILAKFGKDITPNEAQMLAFESDQLTRAVNECKAMGYTVDEYPIKLAIKLPGNGVLALADMKHDVIWLTRDIFSHGEASLTAALIEEWVHLKFRYNDMSRELQTWLLNNLVRMGRAYLLARKDARSAAPWPSDPRDLT